MSKGIECVNTTWLNACEFMQQRLCKETYEQWINCIVPLSLNEESISLGVSDDFFADWLENNYKDIITEALHITTSKEYEIIFKTGHFSEELKSTIDEISEPATREEVKGGTPDVRTAPKSVPNCHPEHTFDNFVVGEDNRFAFTAASTAAKSPGTFNPLFIYGGVGLGKTHLLQAVAHEYIQSHQNSIVEFVPCETLMNLYVDSLRMRKHWEFRNRFRAADILLVDDIQFLAKGTQIQEEFFNTFNQLYNEKKQIILSSDKQPTEINGLEERLVSRFEFGVTTEIISPSLETRLAILRKKQEKQLIKIDEEILYFLAQRIVSNIRRLEGALIHLVAYASMTGCEITLDLADQLLGNIIGEEVASRKVSIEAIQKKVADFYDIRESDIRSSKRPKNIAVPRMIAMYFSRMLTDHSFPEIGEAFGGKNHATVMHAVKRIKSDIESDNEFKRELDTIKRHFQN